MKTTTIKKNKSYVRGYVHMQEQLLALLEHFYVSMFVNEEMADSSHRIIEDDEEEEEPQLSLVVSIEISMCN